MYNKFAYELYLFPIKENEYSLYITDENKMYFVNGNYEPITGIGFLEHYDGEERYKWYFDGQFIEGKYGNNSKKFEQYLKELIFK